MPVVYPWFVLFSVFQARSDPAWIAPRLVSHHIQYESSRTSQVGGSDFWALGGPNDVKFCR